MVCVDSECSQSGAIVVTTRVKLAARSNEEESSGKVEKVDTVTGNNNLMVTNL